MRHGVLLPVVLAVQEVAVEQEKPVALQDGFFDIVLTFPFATVVDEPAAVQAL